MPLPPFPALEGVLATEIGEGKIGGTDDGVHKSIIDDDSGPGLVLGHSADMPSNHLGFIPNSFRLFLSSSLTATQISAFSLVLQQELMSH